MRRLLFVFCAFAALIAPFLSARADDMTLDPEEGKYFVLSFTFELKAAPRPSERVALVSKIVNFGRAANGYGLSIRALTTSVRPQLYWSAGGTDGGLYTFGDYPFRARHLYAMTLVARPREFAALYLQERAKQRAPENSRGTEDGPVVFLGAHELTNVTTPKNAAAFNYKSPSETGNTDDPLERRAYGATVSSVFIALPEKFPDSRDKLTTELQGAPEALAKAIPRSEIGLWELGAVPAEPK